MMSPPNLDLESMQDARGIIGTIVHCLGAGEWLNNGVLELDLLNCCNKDHERERLSNFVND